MINRRTFLLGAATASIVASLPFAITSRADFYGEVIHLYESIDLHGGSIENCLIVCHNEYAGFLNVKSITYCTILASGGAHEWRKYLDGPWGYRPD